MTRGSTLFASLLATGLLVGACNGPTSSDTNQSSASSAKKSVASSKDIGDVLASVNGMDIGSKEFDEVYTRTVSRRSAQLEGDEKDKKKEVLDKVISDKLLYQEALRQGLDQDPRIQKMMINSLLRKDVYGLIKTTDIAEDELQAYFETHKDEFVVPEKVQVRRILIKVEGDLDDGQAKSLANDLQKKLTAESIEFKATAIEHSDGPYAKRGGDIGFISEQGKPGVDADVVKNAFELERDAISTVFKTDEGYNIIQVMNRRERIERTFDQMKGAVLRKVKTDKYKTHLDDYVSGLKTSANIDINQGKLDSHTIDMPKAPSPGAPRVNLRDLKGNHESRSVGDRH